MFWRFLLNMREKFQRFMYGRHGQDEFARFLITAAVACAVLNIFVKNTIIYWLAWILIVYAYFRILSKNHQARYAENQKYLQLTYKFRYWFDQQKKLAGERKYHHIYSCPKCRQKIRIPKGKGKIMVRCPKCQHEFQKRS